MKMMSDIYETVEWSLKKRIFSVFLQPNQYHLNQMNQYQPILEGTDILLQGTITQQSESGVVLEYTLDSDMGQLSEVLLKLDEYERLQLAQQLYILNDLHHSVVCPFLNPNNLFVIGRKIKIAHRGLVSSVYPESYSEEDFMKQYRAMVLYILHPKLNFNDLINGNGTLKDELSQRIQSLNSVQDIIQVIDEQLYIEDRKHRFQYKTVKKSRFNLFKWGSIVLGVSTVLSLTGVGYYYFHEVPMEKRVITAESKFIDRDYQGVLSTLTKDNPTTLPRSAQYVAAVSSIKLDNLSNNQKNAILKNISQKSNENVLLYWMYIGNGDFKEALDVAQNIGDSQYILHAYIKLYDATKADAKMAGDKKQELLKKYDEEIKKYTKQLGGK